MLANAFRFGPSDDPPGERSARRAPLPPGAAAREELAYKVELWDEGGEVVEQVLAATSSASIGYAAYYAATREFPEALITLRHNDTIMSRSGGRPH